MLGPLDRTHIHINRNRAIMINPTVRFGPNLQGRFRRVFRGRLNRVVRGLRLGLTWLTKCPLSPTRIAARIDFELPRPARTNAAWVDLMCPRLGRNAARVDLVSPRPTR
ncbi:unnamed protein product, partial [Prunus brigantina]